MKNISGISCLLVITILSVVCAAARVKDECPFSYDFKRYTENTSDGTIQFCAKLFLKKETWDFSNAFCRLHFSSLTYKIGLNSTLHREWIDEEFPRDELLWVGIRRIANFFVVNSTGRLYREKTDTTSPKFWGDRWYYRENRNHDCVALNVRTGDLVTRDCNSQLYYICDDRGVPHPEKLPEEPSCPVGVWIFSYYLIGTGRKCISTFKPQPAKDAVEACGEYKGRLATTDEYNIMFSGNSSQFNKITAYWADTENYESCVFKTFQVVNGSTNEHSENCSKSLPFICVKDLENRDVQVWISPSNFPPFPSTSTCDSNPDLFKCNVKIDGKEFFGKKEVLLYQWYKDDIPIAQNANGFRMSYFADPMKKNSSNTDIVIRQGSYHCEVRIVGSWRSFSSQKMDFFYSDIATYIINIHGLIPYDFRDYSEQDFTDYMAHFNSYVNNEQMTNISEYVNTTWDFQSISVHDGIATSKIFLYIYRSDNKLDEEIYQEIKSVFNHTTVDTASSTLRYLSFSVSSADVCFSKELENDTCEGNIRWPTSIQTASVNTESICIDNSKRLVPRKCKASSTTKAEWSEFNCSSCQYIQSRVKDLDIHCSEGYVKFTNTNLCFKIYYEEKTWHDAHRICSESSSYMLNEFYDIDKSFFETPLNRFWLSYTYSHGKIQRIGMKPKNSKIKYSWTISNPDFHCLAAVLLHEDYTSVLENCNRKLSFVCVQDPFKVVSSVKFSNTWNRLSTQRNCYYFAKKDAYYWQEAEKECRQMEPKADFATGILKIKPYRYFKVLMRQLFLKPECQSTSWWINLTYDGKTVDVLDTNAEYLDWDPYTNFNLTEAYGAITIFPNEQIYWTLRKPTTKYKYVCEIQDCEDTRPTQAYIEDRSEESYNTSGGTQYYHGNFSLKCIPSGWFLTRSISWYKDGILLNISSDQLSFTYNSYLSSSLQDLSKYQGYYWCSVDQLKLRQTTFSTKVLFKYKGIHTYVLSMKCQRRFDLDEACVKSMLSEISHPDHEDTALNECFNKRLDVLKVFHLVVRNLTCNSSHVDITAHVYSNNTDEEDILKHIQGANFTRLVNECFVGLESISARSTVACYEEKTELKNEILTWSKTNIGENAIPKELCLKDDGGRVERKCLGDFNTGAVWAPISITECRNSKSEVTERLYQILNSEVSFSSSKEFASLTSSPEKLVSADVEIVAEILVNFSRQSSLEHQILNPVVETINNLYGVSQNVQRETGNAFNEIMKSFEGIASTVDIKNKSIEIAKTNLAVSIQPINFTSSAIPNCVILPDWSKNLTTWFNVSLEEDFQNSINDSTAGIVIPPLLVTEYANISDRLIYQIRKNFNNVKNSTVVSAVIQALFTNVTIYDISPPVKMAFKLNEEFKYANHSSIKCVFWDERLNNSLGGWSYKGCLLKGWNNDLIECSCNHLTSFAIILEGDSKPISKADEDALSYITYVGCSLSCFGLSAIILTFICFRQWRKSVKNKALFNLSVCLLSFMILYMTGMKKTSLGKLCLAISITLHYLLLACFTWMLVSAFLMYLNLVKVFNTYIPRLIQKAMLFAYGVPALIVIIIMSYRLQLYVQDKKYCWLSKDAFFAGIAGPILTILLINFIFFGLILHSNTCGKSKIYLHTNQDTRKQNVTRAKAMFYTSVLLGLSWIFGFLAVGSAKVIFQYLFAITTTLQGFLFFIFFIVKQKSASDMWRKVIFPTSIAEKSHVSHISGSASYSNRIIQDLESSLDNEHRNVLFKTS